MSDELTITEITIESWHWLVLAVVFVVLGYIFALLRRRFWDNPDQKWKKLFWRLGVLFLVIAFVPFGATLHLPKEITKLITEIGKGSFSGTAFGVLIWISAKASWDINNFVNALVICGIGLFAGLTVGSLWPLLGWGF